MPLMEAAAGLVVAEQVLSTAVEGAVVGTALAARRTLPLKATFTRIASSQDQPSHESLHRISGTLNVVNGHAYIFGGSTQGSSQAPIAGNEMHIIRISGKYDTEFDYKCVPALPSIDGGPVPASRKAHSAAVYSENILIFGGPNEAGRVWSFSTETLKWTARDPSDLRTCQVSMNQGAVVHGDQFIVHGSAFEAVSHLQETWSFDLNTNTWSHIASLRTEPGQTSTKSALVDRTLFSISVQRDPNREEHAIWLHYLYLHEDGKPTEWQSIKLPVEPFSGPLTYQGSPLIPVHTGMGRHYLLFQGGRAANFNLKEEDEKPDSPTETGLWVMQIPSDDRSLAKLKDWTREKFGRNSGCRQCAEVELKTKWRESEDTVNHPGPRTHSAMAKVDEKTVLMWCGCHTGSSDGQGDGWIIKLDG
ncbi:MAG: hypothetical protein Q9165_000215 [Trypethelium subeluteriae]